MDPGTYTKIIEIMSGKAIYQQGLVTNCKALIHKGKLRYWEVFGLAHEPV